MAEYVNCFTIVAGAPLQHGIPFETGIVWTPGVPSAKVVLGPRNSGCEVRMGLGDGRLKPVIDMERLLCATYMGERLVREPMRPIEIIVKIVTKDLIFAHEPLAEKLNLWAGGDGPAPCIKQYGNQKDPSGKEQLFRIQNNQRLLVFDTRCAAISLFCVNGEPLIRPVNPGLLAINMSVRANQTNTPSAYAWALHNMERLLGVKPDDDPIVRQLMDSMNRRLSTIQ